MLGFGKNRGHIPPQTPAVFSFSWFTNVTPANCRCRHYDTDPVTCSPLAGGALRPFPTRVCGATYSSATYDATPSTQWSLSEALQKISVACGHQSSYFFGQSASEWSADVHWYTVIHFFDTELFITGGETSPSIIWEHRAALYGYGVEHRRH